MSNLEQVQQFFAWGIDIKPYVGIMITQDEFNRITGEAQTE